MKAWISNLYSKFKRPPKCRFCNRTLVSKESIALGAGRVCAKKQDALLEAEELERQGQLNLFSEAKHEHC